MSTKNPSVKVFVVKLVCIFLIVVGSTHVGALSPEIIVAMEDYRNGKYDEAQRTMEIAASDKAKNIQDRQIAWFYLALIALAYNQTQQTDIYIRQLLELGMDFSPEPLKDTTPSFMERFNKLKLSNNKLPNKLPKPIPFSDLLRNGNSGPKMVKVPTGKFRMGDTQGTGFSPEKPVHEVTISQQLAVSQHEITFEDYDHYCETTSKCTKPDNNGWGHGKMPVINVSWQDARAYTQWLSEQTDHVYRLPTEAEWEYVARAGTETNYWWGNDVGNNKAACDGCDTAISQPAPVGTYIPNPFGIYDTAGNVGELTCSKYENHYTGEELRCTAETLASGQLVVARGGAWDESHKKIRAAYRKGVTPIERSNNIGFRVVREE